MRGLFIPCDSIQLRLFASWKLFLFTFSSREQPVAARLLCRSKQCAGLCIRYASETDECTNHCEHEFNVLVLFLFGRRYDAGDPESRARAHEHCGRQAARLQGLPDHRDVLHLVSRRRAHRRRTSLLGVRPLLLVQSLKLQFRGKIFLEIKKIFGFHGPT